MNQAQARHPCPWREFSLMLELVCRAVLPNLSLVQSLAQWDYIRYQLAEPPRRRKRKIEQWMAY